MAELHTNCRISKTLEDTPAFWHTLAPGELVDLANANETVCVFVKRLFESGKVGDPETLEAPLVLA